jgi:hypothetical protein
MCEIIRKIPYHIVHSNIIPYTYRIQDSALLFDIRNFSESKHVISVFYYNKYRDLLHHEKNADKYWLLSDILLFIKRNKPEIFKVVNKKYIRFLRISKCDFDHFWSILTPSERNDFIKIRTRL